MGFKETWLLKDKRCPTCNAITERQKGITKENIRRLIIPQWNMTELLITLLLLMIILLSYVYLNETKLARDWVGSMQGKSLDQCIGNCEYRCNVASGIYQNQTQQNVSINYVNVSIFNLTKT